jgi:uncharacterized protein (TIGR00369 family)|tara:strand:- start:469 stop:876 length:408 start_codon:yes stop_codon:yes gene_type:complete
MNKKFEQISLKSGFMKHNGGLLFRKISKTKYELKTKIKKNHLNKAGITHGGYIASIIDAGCGTGAHRVSNNKICVTISLDIKFIDGTRQGDIIVGSISVQKITRSLVFLECKLKCKKRLIAFASGVWKKTNKEFN